MLDVFKKSLQANLEGIMYFNLVIIFFRFLHDNGLVADQFGYFITKNPFIFEQQLEDLQVRINYLEAKKFTSSAITRIVTRNPLWLNFR